MNFPDDILLPNDAKYFGFIDYKNSYNSEYDITWSFSYSLSGHEHGFGTFLTNQSVLSGIPGHYMGVSGTLALSSYIQDENRDNILTEDSSRLLTETSEGSDYNHCLSIVFDSSGYYGLSSISRDGLPLSLLQKDVLCIRDSVNSLVVYEQLSNLNPDFQFSNTNLDSYETLRFRYANASKKLTIDFKNDIHNKYTTLTSISVDLKASSYGNVYPGFTFCSPISSNDETPSTLKLKNFHSQGVSDDTTVLYSPFTPLTSISYSNYTTISTVST